MSARPATLRLHQVPLPSGGGADLREVVARRLRLEPDEVLGARLVKRSVDARRGRPRVLATIDADVRGGAAVIDRFRGDPDVRPAPPPGGRPEEGRRRIGSQPIVVGAGPAGLFAALALARKGHAPLLVERGKAVRPRWKDVRAFWSKGVLDEESNVVFGEGGAGTFSDGKVYTRRNDPRNPFILGTLARLADAPDILTSARPHLGTNRLSRALLALRDELEAAGVEVRFSARLEELEVRDGRVVAAVISGERLETDAVFLAAGHSARDVQELLLRAGARLESRPFAVGARIEHPQEMIDARQYGDPALAEELGAASYSLAWRGRGTLPSAHTFCTCPGGEVVAASTEQDALTVNGMSYSHRRQPFCNSAVVAEVGPADYGGDGPLAGVAFQRELERAAARAGGRGHVAPAQRTVDFMSGTRSTGAWETSYRRGVVGGDLSEVLPERVTTALRKALRSFGRRIEGFDTTGHLIGVEARTTSPVRVVRDPESFESVTVSGLFPLGEGAGHAGGIVSAASDALRAVERIAPARSGAAVSESVGP